MVMVIERFTLSAGESTSGEWFDIGLRRVLNGVVDTFYAEDKISGKWHVTVRVAEQAGKAMVEVMPLGGTSYVHDQIRRKTITFNACKDRRFYYHPLGLAYLLRGRLSYERIEDLARVPEAIRNDFRIEKYEDVSPTPAGRTWTGKLVAVVEKERHDKMAKLFVMEKILPVFES